jgi:hypothetical protein
VDRWPRFGGGEAELQPGEFPAELLPSQVWRMVHAGVVYEGREERDYGRVRFEHAAICPSLPAPRDPELARLRRRLAHRLARTGRK